MKWEKQYEINVPFLDQQHREWFDHVAKLGKSIDQRDSDAEMARALKFVVEYTRKHFAEEEAFMQDMDYPGLESQKKLHKGFETYIVEVLTSLKHGNEVPAMRLYRFMSDWIKRHIQEQDQKIDAYIASSIAEIEPDTRDEGESKASLAVKLRELSDMLASELISEIDFASKKVAMLREFAADASASEPDDAMAKLEKLKTLIGEGLLSENDLEAGREHLAHNVNLSKELALRNGAKDKMIHLKNLFGEQIISADQFETHKAEILEQM